MVLDALSCCRSLCTGSPDCRDLSLACDRRLTGEGRAFLAQRCLVDLLGSSEAPPVGLQVVVATAVIGASALDEVQIAVPLDHDTGVKKWTFVHPCIPPGSSSRTEVVIIPHIYYEMQKWC